MCSSDESCASRPVRVQLDGVAIYTPGRFVGVLYQYSTMYFGGVWDECSEGRTR